MKKEKDIPMAEELELEEVALVHKSGKPIPCGVERSTRPLVTGDLRRVTCPKCKEKEK